MPLVTVRYKADKLPDNDLMGLGVVLRKTVRQALAVNGNTHARLAPEDIEVVFTAYGPHDLKEHDVGITVFANTYPERKENLADRREDIATNVSFFFRKSSPAITAYVWVILVDASFTVM